MVYSHFKEESKLGNNYIITYGVACTSHNYKMRGIRMFKERDWCVTGEGTFKKGSQGVNFPIQWFV